MSSQRAVDRFSSAVTYPTELASVVRAEFGIPSISDLKTLKTLAAAKEWVRGAAGNGRSRLSDEERASGDRPGSQLF